MKQELKNAYEKVSTGTELRAGLIEMKNLLKEEKNRRELAYQPVSYTHLDVYKRQDLERVADHCSNIAVCILQVQEDSFDTHSYLEQVKSQSNEEFHRIVAKEREQYVLP